VITVRDARTSAGTGQSPQIEETPRDAVLSVEGLYKTYGAFVAVDHISFSVRPGETFGILGPNGAGKTTTMEMIEGLRDPDGGTITCLGKDAVRNRSRMQQRIGVQLQSQSLWPELTVEETLKLFGSLFSRRVAVDDLLDRFSLADKRRALVKDLSGGQKQRLSIATALVNDPDLVFLDEPTTGLDPQARHSFWDLIRDIREQGKTVIITTHYMEEAEALCDRVAIMDGGRIMALDTPHELIRRLASESTIECSFRGDSVSRTVLAELPGVRDVRAENGSTMLFTSDVSATLNSLVHASDDRACPIKDLNVRSSTLEDVFILLTGRRLRD
jgi:ABC-2 type transport system ATP-binding protein